MQKLPAKGVQFEFLIETVDNGYILTCTFGTFVFQEKKELIDILTDNIMTAETDVEDETES